MLVIVKIYNLWERRPRREFAPGKLPRPAHTPHLHPCRRRHSHRL